MIDHMTALGAIISILLSVIAYFIRQLHSNFHQVEMDVTAMKTNIEVIKVKLKATCELLQARMDFLEEKAKEK